MLKSSNTREQVSNNVVLLEVRSNEHRYSTMIAKGQPQAADSAVYDVIIIGAGPCGLATAARLREHHPSALFTDEEQARYSWISRSTSVKNRRSGKVSPPSKGQKTTKELSILVLDATSDTWLHRWNSLFSRLHIEYLRSPMFFHPDPQEWDALLAYCHTLNRTSRSKSENNIQEIAGCVGKEISKHTKKKRMGSGSAKAPRDINERDRQDYFAPSAKAFRPFCEECVERYDLDRLVRKGKVVDVKHGVVPSISDTDKVFSIRTTDRVFHSRTAVLAMGGGDPVIPAPFQDHAKGSSSHALDLSTGSSFVPHSVHCRLTSALPTNILILGGGLTSAQVADHLLSRYPNSNLKIHHLMRSAWKIKPFDVDLDWMGKWRNTHKAYFWSEDDLAERLEMAKKARGGGSITPRYTRVLREWIRKGRLEVHTHTCVVDAKWNEQDGEWDIKTAPGIALPKFHHVVFATGLGSDVNTLPVLGSLRKTNPIETYGGFPALNSDLMWDDGVPFFMTGRMAMLQLGPGAGNLEGARVGAERIAWGIEKVLDGAEDGEENDGMEESVDRYVKGIGSKYEGLSIMDEDSGVEL